MEKFEDLGTVWQLSSHEIGAGEHQMYEEGHHSLYCKSVALTIQASVLHMEECMSMPQYSNQPHLLIKSIKRHPSPIELYTLLSQPMVSILFSTLDWSRNVALTSTTEKELSNPYYPSTINQQLTSRSYK
jgi:hypothetical protein